MSKLTGSLRVRVVLFILISGMIPLTIAFGLVHHFSTTTLVLQHREDLANLAKARSEILDNHIEHIVSKLELLAEDAGVRAYASNHKGDLAEDIDFWRAGVAMAKAQSKLWGDAHHVFLSDLSGDVIMNPAQGLWCEEGASVALMRHSPGPHHGENISDMAYFQQATEQTTLTDVFGFQERDHYHQLAMTPVRDQGGEVVGVLCIEISIGRLGALISAAEGSSSQMYLATREGIRVVEKKADYDPTPIHLPQESTAGDWTTGWFDENSGERLLGAYHPSETYPWVVCVETPESAALGSFSELNRAFIAVFLTGLVSLALLAYIGGTLLFRPISALVRDSERVSGGVLDHEINVTRKDELGKLQRSVEHVRRALKQQIDHLDSLVAERTSELEYVNERLARDAREDKLTGLANREVMRECVDRELSRFGRDHDHKFAVLFFDFDRFKIVNDSLGHATGDALLCSIADRFRAHLRKQDTAARFGGDEFVVCLSDLESDEEALEASERLLKIFDEPHEINGHRLISTASIGLVTIDQRYRDAEELIRDADAAMYEAKLAGKGQVMVFDQRMHEVAQNRLRIEHGMSHAIERNELRVMYQPIIRIDEMKLDGFEALIRWQHPEMGLVRPDQFIPIAEDTGQIVEIGNWILNESLRQLGAWDAQHGGKALSMNVNVAKRQLIHPGFIDHVRSALEKHKIAPERVKLEITESTAIDPRHDMSQTIRDVKSLGVKIAMDDFGTGHSSLSLLHQFDLDVIKIDKSFIQGMELSREMSAVLHSIIALAQNMGKSVVAEGVETQEQIATLLSHSCDLVQGYYFSKPLDTDDAERFIYMSDRLLNAA